MIEFGQYPMNRARDLFCILMYLGSQIAFGAEAVRPIVDRDGTIHIPSFSVPLSRYMSEEAKRAFIEQARTAEDESQDINLPIAKQRAASDASLKPLVERAKARYPVVIEERHIGGVRVDIVTPKAGVVSANEKRVLINLHSGGFGVGAGLGGLSESIPIAGVGKFKVISVDYRMAPEHSFPAASEDVASVYVELLKQYPAGNIGLYGCSAGGVLSAMAAAWFQKEKLPAPGALALFSAGAFARFDGSPADPNTWGGDSRFLAPVLMGNPPLPLDGLTPMDVSGALNYTGNVDKNDPMASPALSPEILRKFPPTLLLTGTRAHDMSAAIQTHRLLTKAGTEADLHLWDGMGHCFFVNPDLPESHEAFAVMSHFFDSHLGR